MANNLIGSRLSPWIVVVVGILAVGTLAGCYRLQGSSGGGEARFEPPRVVDPSDVAVPEGYQVEAVVEGLTFPTDVAFDEQGRLYVTEAGYSYGERFTTPRLLRLEESGELSVVATGAKNGPWNGLTFHEGSFYVAEGGELEGGSILQISLSGEVTPLVEDLPSVGDHHTNGPAVGPDGWIYFGQGTATNSAVVGEDNAGFGWLKRYPEFHDRPCKDITLTGKNFQTENPLTSAPDDQAVTGAYVPFGTKTKKGQTIEGQVPCNGAIMRVQPGGGAPELVAWGLRNPFGLAFTPGGDLYVAENSFDVRGSRPAWGSGDYLWKITPDTWYGWPDFAGGVPLKEGHFKPPGKPAPSFLLAEHPNEPPKPSALLGVHSSSSGIDFSRSAAFGHEGDAFVAQFGDMAPGVGKVLSPVGYQVVRVDVTEGTVYGFASNKGEKVGPASKLGTEGLERPVNVVFGPDGETLYIVDFGVMTTSEEGPLPRPSTGVIWRITRTE